MKNLLILCMSLIIINGVTAQHYSAMTADILANVFRAQMEQNFSEEAPLPIYAIRGAYPEFPGGETEMMKYIQENVEFPELARSHGHEGTVVVEFVVQTDGKVGQIKVVKSIGLGCDEAAVAVFKNMPSWKPAFQGGKTVAVKYTTPVKFRLY